MKDFNKLKLPEEWKILDPNNDQLQKCSCGQWAKTAAFNRQECFLWCFDCCPFITEFGNPALVFLPFKNKDQGSTLNIEEDLWILPSDIKINKDIII